MRGLVPIPNATLAKDIFAGESLQARIGSISESGATSVDANGNTANQIAEPNGDASPEQRISSVVVALGVDLALGDRDELRGENDRHNHTVDSHNLAENDGNQVLGPDSGCPNTTADDRGAGEEDTPVVRRPAVSTHNIDANFQRSHIPCSSHHRTTNAQCDTNVCPRVRRHLFEEAADLVRVMSVKYARNSFG